MKYLWRHHENWPWKNHELGKIILWFMALSWDHWIYDPWKTHELSLGLVRFFDPNQHWFFTVFSFLHDSNCPKPRRFLWAYKSLRLAFGLPSVSLPWFLTQSQVFWSSHCLFRCLREVKPQMYRECALSHTRRKISFFRILAPKTGFLKKDVCKFEHWMIRPKK